MCRASSLMLGKGGWINILAFVVYTFGAEGTQESLPLLSSFSPTAWLIFNLSSVTALLNSLKYQRRMGNNSLNALILSCPGISGLVQNTLCIHPVNLPAHGPGLVESGAWVARAGAFHLSARSRYGCHWATPCSPPCPWLCSLWDSSLHCLSGWETFL